MINALIVSNIVLWVVVIALAVLVLALMRQIGVLHERISPAGALVGREGPRIGDKAPEFKLEDWSGQSVRVGARDPDGRSTLLFFVSPTCPVCETLLPVIGSIARQEKARLVIASDGTRSEHERFVRAHELDGKSYVLSRDLGIAYQVGKVPYAVLIDAGGIVRAKGLVNTREHVESLFEASARGVGSLQEWVKERGAVHGQA